MHYKYAINFSGGRDSLALLSYMTPLKDQSIVVWVDAGGTLPEVENLILSSVKGWNFVRIVTNSWQWIELNGLPSEIVPIWFNADGAVISGNKKEISSCLTCCYENIMKPLHEISKQLGVSHIVRGQRRSDKLKSPIESGFIDSGITYLFPLQDWTDEQVNDYLKYNNVDLPEWYKYGNKGFDCWHCTGYKSESDGLHKYLAKHHAEKYSFVENGLNRIRNRIAESLI